MADAPINAAQQRFSSVAILLHWIIAVLILINIALALQFDDLKGMAKFNLMQLHKSLGITVLLLSLVRLGWRATHRSPPYPEHMPTWEKAAASALHWAFYALIIAIPLTGWAVVSASPTNIPTLLYKAIPWPHIGYIHSLPMATRKPLEENLGDLHGYLAYGSLVLLVLHVGAALKHQVWNRDYVLWQMLPIGGLKPKPQPSKDS